MKFDFDVIVIGGGHAGCEAAVASAHLGCSTLLITGDLNRVAQMSCNPAVGGIAKGQIVREIDALGGMMGIVTDLTTVQFRMLNRSKGPAVWSPRAQSDRTAFTDEWRKILDSTAGLSLFQDYVVEFLLDQNPEETVADSCSQDSQRLSVSGVRTALGLEFRCRKAVLTAGTFLNGLMHFGSVKVEGGRIAEPSSHGLTEQLRSLGFRVSRMKTGTPARLDGSTIDFSRCVLQWGDDEPVCADGNRAVPIAKLDFHKFSFLPGAGQRRFTRPCYITHTNPECHAVLNANLKDSPLFNGDIQSIGPRYCPSIETKIVTFADKESHQLFLEPEGFKTAEYYVNGFSSSLPWQVQVDALSLCDGLEQVQLYRPGYAIEYDYIDPLELTHDLQTRRISGLYFAGQVNGTTGYEEAAAQGLMAGINAARAVKGDESIVLGRDQAYIGVLIDDLVTKGVDEPYRMFTSRAEYRIILRQDDADMRLTPLGYEIGLASPWRYELMEEKRRLRDDLIAHAREILIKPNEENNRWLREKGTAPLTAGIRLAELIKRPGITIQMLRELSESLDSFIRMLPGDRRDEIVEAAEILIKYDGYILRERDMADKAARLENVKIPHGFDYTSVTAISTEARQKLSAQRPDTIGQASRIPGVSPADINVLLLLIRR